MNVTQHGLRERHSTITMILQFYVSILEAGDPVNAIYLDFSKAFDKDHQILLKKAKSLGIEWNILA